MFYQYIIYPIVFIYRSLFLFLASALNHYGLALIVLSFLTFMITRPLMYWAEKLQNEERLLQEVLKPQREIIKKVSKGQEQYQRIQRLYNRYGYHPIMAIRSVVGIIFQIPFLVAAFYMLSNCSEIRGVSWGAIVDLSRPDNLLQGFNVLPLIMALVSILYAFIIPTLSSKQRLHSYFISLIFLVLLYNTPSALIIYWSCNLLWPLLYLILFKKSKWFNDCIEFANNYFKKNDLAFHIIFALTLTVGLLVPLELYIKNASELWFSFKDILKYFLSNTAQCILVLVVLYFICWRKKIRVIYLSLLFGLLLGVFLQSYFLNLNYGLIDGHEIKWEEYKWQGIVNTFIWLVCIGETFIIFRRLKFDDNIIKKYVKPISFGIISIQCVVLIFSFIKNPLPSTVFEGKKAINVLTTKDMFTISSKDNIIVFLLDAFDAKIFEEIMVKDPEIIDKLTGFTFYPDTTSVYGYTDYSLPQILTGKVFYNDRPYAEYFQEAWKDNPYYQKLLQNNFDIGIYTDGSHVYKEAPISNLKNEKVVFNNNSMYSFDNLVKFRLMPHIIKKRFYAYDPNDRKRLMGEKNLQVYKVDDRKFYLDLKNNLKIRNDKNCFKFYHLNGAHPPFVLDENVEPVKLGEKGHQYSQAVGAIKIVLRYIEQLKQKDLFNSSTFVIMADHGDHNKIGSRALFCFKEAYESSEFKVSNNPVTLINFMDIMLRKFQSFGDKKISSRERTFFYMDDNNGFIKYQIIGNAKFLDSWKKQDLKKWENDANIYELGKEVDFTMFGDSKKYKKDGWSRREEKHGTWSLGEGASLAFKIKDFKKQDLKVDFIAYPYLINNLSHRNLRIYVNGNFLKDIYFDSRAKFSFVIPANYISSDELNLYFSIDQPGISVQYEVDGRDLGLILERLKIEPTN